MLSYLRRALEDFSMISENDSIAVGVSAGKDSLALLVTLSEIRRFYPIKFDLCAITVDMGFKEPMDFSPIAALCKDIGVPYIVRKSDIAEVVFDVRKESNPCSLCAKMRRGALNESAVEAGCNKVALGHNNDDAIETFFLSLFFEGRISCFTPVTHLDRKEIYTIRPLIYVPESKLKSFARKQELPVIKSPCPANGNTKRQEMKEYIAEMQRKDHKFKRKTFGAIKRGIWKIDQKTKDFEI